MKDAAYEQLHHGLRDPAPSDSRSRTGRAKYRCFIDVVIIRSTATASSTVPVAFMADLVHAAPRRQRVL